MRKGVHLKGPEGVTLSYQWGKDYCIAGKPVGGGGDFFFWVNIRNDVHTYMNFYVYYRYR